MDRTSAPIDTAALAWMPLSPGVWARPLRFAGEERTLQLKVAPGAGIALHRHSGPVHALNVSGRRKLASGEIAGPGAYVFEPAGNEDWWACEGDEPCIVHITMSGRVEYVGPDGAVLSYTDTPKLRAQYLRWCAEAGIAPAALGAR